MIGDKIVTSTLLRSFSIVCIVIMRIFAEDNRTWLAIP